MALTYQEVYDFMNSYFETYSEKGQFVETQSVLDEFYEEEIYFVEGIPTPRAGWYESITRHPAVQDKLTLQRLYFDAEHQDCVCLVHTQAIERATGNVIVDLNLSVYYRFKMVDDTKFKISHVNIYLEPNPEKSAKLSKAYNILPGK